MQPLNFLCNQLFLPAHSLILFLCDKPCLITDFPKPQICIVLTQQKAVFRAGSHHTVRFKIFLCDKVVNQDTDICLGTVKHNLFLSLDKKRRIHSGNQPLCSRLFITTASIKLTRTKESLYFFEFQSRIKLVRIHTVILDGISIPHNFTVFQPRYCPVHGKLDILRKGRTHPADIHFICVKSLRFNKHLMPLLLSKFDNLVLNGRTVSWSSPLNHAGINRRTVKIGTYDIVCLFICISKPAGSLLNLHILRICGKRKRNNSFIAKLLLHLRKIKRTFIHPRRSTCLKTPHFYPKQLQTISQKICSLQTIRSCMCNCLTTQTPCF